MGFMDKVVSKAKEVGEAGHAKVDNVQAKRQIDNLYEEVGSLVYAAQAGREKPEHAAQLEQAIAKLRELEAGHPDLFGAAVPAAATTTATASTDASRQYHPGVPAPANLYPPGVFALDDLGYPQLSEIGTPYKTDGRTDWSFEELEALGIKYPSPDDQRYWLMGMGPPW